MLFRVLSAATCLAVALGSWAAVDGGKYESLGGCDTSACCCFSSDVSIDEDNGMVMIMGQVSGQCGSDTSRTLRFNSGGEDTGTFSGTQGVSYRVTRAVEGATSIEFLDTVASQTGTCKAMFVTPRECNFTSGLLAAVVALIVGSVVAFFCWQSRQPRLVPHGLRGQKPPLRLAQFIGSCPGLTAALGITLVVTLSYISLVDSCGSMRDLEIETDFNHYLKSDNVETTQYDALEAAVSDQKKRNSLARSRRLQSLPSQPSWPHLPLQSRPWSSGPDSGSAADAAPPRGGGVAGAAAAPPRAAALQGQPLGDRGRALADYTYKERSVRFWEVQIIYVPKGRLRR
jgi:hypothetical protein